MTITTSSRLAGLLGMLSLLPIASAGARAPAVAAASASVPAPVVILRDGAVQGVRQHGDIALLGIPYAAPPVGARRWKAPAPVVPWRGVRPATRFGAACMQGPARAFGPYTAEFLNAAPVSEDCLTLNVWTPRVDAARRPVLVFIHGGGFGSGSTAIPQYDGAALARRGVVVVTINYRLGLFGFLAHPDLMRESGRGTSGNYGVLDMLAALRWVQANITRLGGDPHNVTIAGESAGAAAVNDLLLAPAAHGLFGKAIAMSGAGMGVDVKPLATAEAYGRDFAARAGAQDIAALRAMDASRLQQLADVPPPTTGKRPTAPEIRFAPNNDGVVIAGNSVRGGQAVANPVPLMTGFNADEGTALGMPENAADFVDMVRGRYGASSESLLTLYPHATDADARRSAIAIARDRYMASLLAWTHERVGGQGGRVLLYLYDHPYPAAAGGPAFGAFHTAAVPYLFGNLGQGPRQFGPNDAAMAQRLQDHVLAFMRSGDPSTPVEPWRAATVAGTTVLRLAADGAEPVPAVSSPERLVALLAFRRAGGLLTLF